jgi:hypothetical protein
MILMDRFFDLGGLILQTMEGRVGRRSLDPMGQTFDDLGIVFQQGLFQLRQVFLESRLQFG